MRTETLSREILTQGESDYPFGSARVLARLTYARAAPSGNGGLRSRTPNKDSGCGD